MLRRYIVPFASTPNERGTIASVETVAFYAKRHLNRKTCDGFPTRDGAPRIGVEAKGRYTLST
jgi:hypothetical protein